MEYSSALSLATGVVERLKPYCSRIEIAGSIRRHRAQVHDIDIVLIPQDPWGLIGELPRLGRILQNGPKIKWIALKDISVDIYFASPESWATLLLIRTGSMQNNIRLCAIAKRKGMTLHASGEGLFEYKGSCQDGHLVRVAGDTEQSIYEALGEPYQIPEEREVTRMRS